jgi:putative ABC transport system permease protein
MSVLIGFGAALLAVSSSGRGSFDALGSSGAIGLGATGALLLLLGASVATPIMMDRVSALAALLPFTGRYAVRYAARHRLRSSGAAVILMVIVGSAVFALFAIQGAVKAERAEATTPPHSLAVTFNHVAGEHTTADDLDDVSATVHSVLGAATEYRLSSAAGRQPGYSRLKWVAGSQRFGDVGVVSARTLAFIIGDDDAAALNAFTTGGIVAEASVTGESRVATVAVIPRPHAGEHLWHLPVHGISVRPDMQSFGRAWVSVQTAHRLGLVLIPSQALYVTGHDVTRDEVARLQVYGIHASSRDIDESRLRQLQTVAVAVVGALTLVVVALVVGLTSAEGRADTATLSAVGAPPWRRRAVNAAYAAVVTGIGSALGCALGLTAALVLDADAAATAADVPWRHVVLLLVGVPALAAGVGALVSRARVFEARRST